MLQNNFIALVVTFILAVIWLRINDFAAHRGWISSDISRKLIHIGTGPLFVLCWLLFDDSPSARFLAALIPLAITMQFLLVGLGVIRDEAAVKAMARSGDRREILRGPLFYGIVFVLLTIIYWKNSLIGITALMLLCGGDGLADIIGRRFGRLALPWNSQKTWAGSMGMILGGWLFAALIPVAYLATGEISGVFSAFLPALTIIALAGAAVESLPTGDYDNLTVPLAALLLGHLLLPTV